MNFVTGGFTMAAFTVGQVIHHRRYDYRGVVVKVDSQCRADDEWYSRNQTQPDRAQPWYHVLVDGGRETYVAEDNLEADSTNGPVEHPMVPQFFPTFHEGRYYIQSLN
jgi:heat shock protein HspQ